MTLRDKRLRIQRRNCLSNKVGDDIKQRLAGVVLVNRALHTIHQLGMRDQIHKTNNIVKVKTANQSLESNKKF